MAARSSEARQAQHNPAAARLQERAARGRRAPSAAATLADGLATGAAKGASPRNQRRLLLLLLNWRVLHDLKTN
jgi:hypothetical protein